MTLVSILMLSLLGLFTYFLARNKRRALNRWHFQHRRFFTYQQFVDLLLIIVQLLVMTFLMVVGNRSVLSQHDLFFELKTINWDWHLLFFGLLYVLTLVEIPLLVLLVICDILCQKDSRLHFKKMNWLAFKKDKVGASSFILILTLVVDAFLYLGLLLSLTEDSSYAVFALIVAYGLIKALRYRDSLSQVLALTVGIWTVTATLLYGWPVGTLLLALTYILLSFKEQH
ncbi:SagF family protein [Streptococcus ictaluri]|nr:SagF family protein [Streptococcus ictaluri]